MHALSELFRQRPVVAAGAGVLVAAGAYGVASQPVQARTDESLLKRYPSWSRKFEQETDFVEAVNASLKANPTADSKEVELALRRRPSWAAKFEGPEHDFAEAVVVSMSKADEKARKKGLVRRPSWCSKFESPGEMKAEVAANQAAVSTPTK